MSIRHIAQCFYTTSLRPNQRLVAIALADYADDHGRAFPSLGNIARKTGYSRRQTQRIVQELTSLGYVEILIEATWNRTPLYQLHPEKLAGGDNMTPPDQPLPLPPQDMIAAVQTPTEHLIVTVDEKGASVEIAVPRGDTSDAGGDTSGTQEVTPAAQGGDTGDTQTVMEPSPNHQEPPSGEGEVSRETPERLVDTTTDIEPRPRNLGWDALVEVFGYSPEGKGERALYGQVAAKANLEPDPVLAVYTRARALIAQWGAKALTVTSLNKWWDRFGTPLGQATERDSEKILADIAREQRRLRAKAHDEQPALHEPDSEERRQLHSRILGDGE